MSRTLSIVLPLCALLMPLPGRAAELDGPLAASGAGLGQQSQVLRELTEATAFVEVRSLASDSSRENLEALGISSLRFGPKTGRKGPVSASVSVELVTAGGHPSGSAVVSSVDGRWTVDAEIDGEAVGLIWDETEIAFTLISGSGALGEGKFDRELGKWVMDPRLQDHLREEPDIVHGVAAILAETQRIRFNQGRGASAAFGRAAACQAADFGQTSENIGGCDYSWFSRGWGTGSSRSGCCYEATADVNLKCSNPACLGCCELFPRCDAACAVGDYLCFCGRSGHPCIDPRFP